MASILGDGTGPGGSGPSRCLLLLQRSLAIQLTRGPPPQVLNASQRDSPKEHPADEMWMYDKGYNLFQVSPIILLWIRIVRVVASGDGAFRSSRLISATFFHATICCEPCRRYRLVPPLLYPEERSFPFVHRRAPLELLHELCQTRRRLRELTERRRDVSLRCCKSSLVLFRDRHESNATVSKLFLGSGQIRRQRRAQCTCTRAMKRSVVPSEVAGRFYNSAFPKRRLALIGCTVTPEWDNMNYKQFCESISWEGGRGNELTGGCSMVLSRLFDVWFLLFFFTVVCEFAFTLYSFFEKKKKKF